MYKQPFYLFLIMLVSHPARFWSMPLRIFVARRCGKTAGMLAAFQGFAAPYGGKKTGDILWVLAGWGTNTSFK